MQTYVCTVGTVRSLFRILLVPECCVIKLACTVLSFLSKPWVDCIKGFREQTLQRRDLVFIVYATIRVSEIKRMVSNFITGLSL